MQIQIPMGRGNFGEKGAPIAKYRDLFCRELWKNS